MSKSLEKAAVPADAQGARRRALLDAAVTVFARYGFRKTSMEEVARAAEVSRQGLYLHFATKEDLFRATVRHLLGGALQAATAVLRDPALGLEDKLVRGFDEWMGKFVGMFGGDSGDLGPAATTLMGPVVAEHEALFAEAVSKAISAAGLGAAYKPVGIGARQLTDTLVATARGLKYGSETRAGFVRGMTVAVRALSFPLGASA